MTRIDSNAGTCEHTMRALAPTSNAIVQLSSHLGRLAIPAIRVPACQKAERRVNCYHVRPKSSAEFASSLHMSWPKMFMSRPLGVSSKKLNGAVQMKLRSVA
jgi:hypothetical protein